MCDGMDGYSLLVTRIENIIRGLKYLEKGNYVERNKLIEKAKIDDASIRDIVEMGLVEEKRENEKIFYKITHYGKEFYSIRKRTPPDVISFLRRFL